MRTKDVIDDVVARCKSLGIDPEYVEQEARARIDHLRGSRTETIPNSEEHWYASLRRGDPDFSVYDGEAYLGETIACFAVYSGPALRQLKKKQPLSALLNPETVVDLGCGAGYTTALLAELFPAAEVYGTNLPGTLQTAIAKQVGEEYGFRVVSDSKRVGSGADLVVALEYFEHFEQPVAHLDYVLESLEPSALILMNSFSARSTGHFPEYMIDGALIPGSQTAAVFNRMLRDRGFVSEKFFWNNRPAVWFREEETGGKQGDLFAKLEVPDATPQTGKT